MRRVSALARANWIVFASYRIELVMSVFALLATVVPLYFVSGALQPVMGPVIRDEAHNAFGFLLLGLAAISLVSTAVNALPTQVGGESARGRSKRCLPRPRHCRLCFSEWWRSTWSGRRSGP